jgi:hypothetical protein
MAGQHYKDKGAASFKCVIWYANGFTGVYYSRDLKYGRFRPDLGLKALEELVAKRADRLRHAMIWDKRNGGDRLIRECSRFQDGWRTYTQVNF